MQKDIGTVQSNQAALGVASYVVTTAVLVAALLLVHRRRATWGVATPWWVRCPCSRSVHTSSPGALIVAAIAALVAAAVVDVLLIRLDHLRGTDAPLRLPLAGQLPVQRPDVAPERCR